MAEAVAEGVKEVSGAEVVVKRIPETLSEEVLKMQNELHGAKFQSKHVAMIATKLSAK
ncbi:MAG: hypothetical protein SFU98_06825 [Leptospiraceae bacterium]|nr:hypothetical protein [Leptospiraceae bacterium]